MVFYERTLSGKINNIPLSIVCDYILATPIVNAPRNPYFLPQETPSLPSPEGKENFYKVKKGNYQNKMF